MYGVSELDIANRVRRLFDLAGDAFVSFAADTSGPFGRSSGADFLFPFRTYLRRVVRKDGAGSAAVRTMNLGDVGVRKIHARVFSLKPSVTPFLDLAKIDVGDHVRRET